MARKMLRPMRPKPLMATRTVMTELLSPLCHAGHRARHPSLRMIRWIAGPRPATTILTQSAQCRFRYLFRRNSEMPVKVLIGRAGTEIAHSHKKAIAADDRVPALAHGGFDADAHRGGADDRLAVVVGSGEEKLEAGHRDHARRDPLVGQQLARRQRDDDFGPGREQGNLSAAFRRRDLVGATRAAIVVVAAKAKLRQVLPR